MLRRYLLEEKITRVNQSDVKIGRYQSQEPIKCGDNYDGFLIENRLKVTLFLLPVLHGWLGLGRKTQNPENIGSPKIRLHCSTDDRSRSTSTRTEKGVRLVWTHSI